MTLCLNECLRAVGLQHHHDRFTSMGVCRAVDLSSITLEDYPILGIRSMEDRTRLFNLVQMIKALDLESLEYDEDGADGGYDVHSFTYDDHGDPDGSDEEDDTENSATSATKSCVRRRLTFSSETIDCLQKQLPHPVGSASVCAVHPGYDASIQIRRPDALLQPELDSIRVVVHSKGDNNHRTNDDSRPSKTEEDAMGGFSMYNSLTGLSPKSLLFHQQNHRPAPAAAKSPDRKTAGHKDQNRVLKKERLYTEIHKNGATAHMVNPTTIYECKRRAGYNYGLPLSSPPAPNKRHEAEQRISVCVRKRPLTHAESRRREADVITTSSDECVVVHESKEAVDLTQYILQHRFYFDQVFGENSSNQEVYQRTALPLVRHMLNGGKATCFAYGQTGAGKTHTMLGSSTGRPGLYALAVRDIFAHLSTSDRHSTLLVYVSFFEIYCGQLYDLLDHRKRLFAREDGHGVVHIAGLRDVRVDSVNSLMEVISVGTDERTQGTSGVNPLSSRSHALLKIQLRCPNHQAAGRMWFVDLAGSERASDTKDPDRQSRMEGAEINQSLLALKECIRSLDQEQSHTPFRQSKLTQVLKDSFVGDSMTCMIANISPGHLAAEHTLNTLRYADRVKELRGQGRGGRRAKTLSPKHNLSNSSTSSSGGRFGPRGKSPSKKQKLGRRPEAFVPASPNIRSSTNLCSTPKNSRCAMSRKGIGLEHLTPICREEAGERNRRRLENEKYGGANHQSGGDQNIRAGLELKHPIGKRILREGQHFEVSNDSRNRTEEGGGAQPVECSRDKKRRDGDVKKSDEKDKERRRHLRWYHQQLQQFTSSPASSDNFPSSLHSSVSSSTSLQHDSHLSASALAHPTFPFNVHGSKVNVRADADSGPLPFWSGETEFSLSSDARVDGHWGETREGGGLGDEQTSAEITGEGRLDETPAGMDGVERRWAWSVTDQVTGSMPTEAAAYDERQTADPTGDRGLGPFESPCQRAQAERPLSPASGHVNTPLTLNTLSDCSLQSQPSKSNILHLRLQNPTDSNDPTTSQRLSTSITRWKTKVRTSNILSGGPVSTRGQNHPGIKAKTSALSHNDTDTHSLSHTMDPLSLSLLQVEQQVATASFIRGEQSTPACRVPENNSGEITERFAEVEDEDIHFSFLKLPQANSFSASISDAGIEISPTGRGKDTHGVGWIKPLLLQAELISLDDQETSRRIQTVQPVLGTKPSTCASMQPPATQSTSDSVHLPTANNPTPDAATQSPTESSMQSVLDQSHIVQSSPSYESNKGPSGSGGRGSNNTQQKGATTHLSSLKHLNHAQCHVVRAHLEQLEEMEALYRKEGTLLCQQPDMAFGEYVHKLEEIMERKACCVQIMRAQLQPYLTLSQSNPAHNQ